MAENDIASAVASNLSSAVKDFSVDSATTDGASELGNRHWHDDKWGIYLGYYTDEKTPTPTAIIDTHARWVVGKGYKADPATEMILDAIREMDLILLIQY